MNKKTIIAIVAAMILSVLFTSCKKEDPSSGEKPKASFEIWENGSLNVTFNNTSENADSYYWEFGDGYTSTEVAPEHTYAVYGEKKIKLTASNEYGEDVFTENYTLFAPTGNIKMISTSDNPYLIYIDGIYQGVIQGGTQFTFIVKTGRHDVKYVQQSGYAFYPTEGTITVLVEGGMIYNRVFPEE